MSNQQGPVIKVESSPEQEPVIKVESPPGKERVAEVDSTPMPPPLRRNLGANYPPWAAGFFPPTVSSWIQPRRENSMAISSVARNVSDGLTVSVPRLTQEELRSFYTGVNGTHYMTGILEGNHWDRHEVQNPLPYNHALHPLDYTSYKDPRPNQQYAGVPAAHNMIPTQGPAQDTQVPEFAETTRVRRAPVKTPIKDGAFEKRNRVDNMVLPYMARPETSTLNLNFTSLDEARHAVINRDLYWMPPVPDATIPTNDAQRAGYVRRLLLAMRNRDEVLDKDVEAKRYNATGVDDMGDGYYYKEEDMEKVCWEIVHIAEKLHIYGPKILNTYDRQTLKNVKKDIKLTFEERMQILIKMLCFFKSKCDTFMKGSSLEETIAQPHQKLTQALINREQNDKRAKIIAAGRKVGRPGRSPSRTHFMDGDDDNSDTETRAGAEQGHAQDVNPEIIMQDQQENEDNIFTEIRRA